MQITYDADRVTIDVVNPTAGNDDPQAGTDATGIGAGHGLLGMRERVAAVGGTVRIEHTAGARRSGRKQFRVLATIPARTPMTIRVLIADDQSAIRSGFHLLVDLAPDMLVVGEAVDGRDGVAMARRLRPDVIVMDVRMPGLDGLAATREITGDAELAGTRVLILTTFELDEYVFEALRGGASGFLGKGAGAAELISAIRTVAGGESLLSPQATRALVFRFLRQPEADLQVSSALLADLTPREREAVAWVAQGLSNQEIADELVVSPLTVKTHVNRAMSKLGARDRAQLVVLAYAAGLVRPASDVLHP